MLAYLVDGGGMGRKGRNYDQLVLVFKQLLRKRGGKGGGGGGQCISASPV